MLVSLLEGPGSGLRPYQVANNWLHDAGPLVIDGWERHNLVVPQRQVRQGALYFMAIDGGNANNKSRLKICEDTTNHFRGLQWEYNADFGEDITNNMRMYGLKMSQECILWKQQRGPFRTPLVIT